MEEEPMSRERIRGEVRGREREGSFWRGVWGASL